MSVALINRVLATPLEGRLKYLAIVLANYADDAGGSMFPSVQRLATQLGRSRRTVQYGLQTLRDRGVLIVESPGGGRGRSTRYRFSTVFPQMPENGAIGCTVSAQKKGASFDTKRCNQLHPIRQDPSVQKITGADAPGSIPFRVYAALANQAIVRSLRDDQSDDLANITAWLKTLCAQRPGTPYDSTICRKAIDAALRARTRKTIWMAAPDWTASRRKAARR